MDWTKFEMEPLEFIQKTGYSYTQVADICDRAPCYVGRWFIKTQNRVEPQRRDKRLLGLAYMMLTNRIIKND